MAHPSYEPNAQPPISSLRTAVMASLPIIQYPYVHKTVVRQLLGNPPDRLGMAVTACHPNYYPAQQPPPRLQLDRDVAAAACQGDLSLARGQRVSAVAERTATGVTGPMITG